MSKQALLSGIGMLLLAWIEVLFARWLHPATFSLYLPLILVGVLTILAVWYAVISRS